MASSAGFGIAMAGSLVWGNKNTSKSREIGGALAFLGGRRLVKKSNNQPIVGGNYARDDGEGARLGRNVGGVLSLRAWRQIEQYKNTKIKYVVGLDAQCR
jgi:hypothetical protein